MGYPVYKLIRAVNRQYPNNGFIDYVDVTEDMESTHDWLIDEDLKDLINEAIQEVYIDIARDEVYSFPTVPGQNQYVLPDDCDLRDIQEVTRTFRGGWRPFPMPGPGPEKYVRIVFNPNGGTGEMPDMLVEAESTIKLPTCDFVGPDNTDFLYWQDEYGVNFEPGDEATIFTIGEQTEYSFKAIWNTDPRPVFEYEVTFVTNPLKGLINGTDSEKIYDVVSGETVPEVPTIVEQSGYEFVGWKDPDGVITTPQRILDTIVEENITYTAFYNDEEEENEMKGYTKVLLEDEINIGDGSAVIGDAGHYSVRIPLGGIGVSVKGAFIVDTENNKIIVGSGVNTVVLSGRIAFSNLDNNYDDGNYSNKRTLSMLVTQPAGSGLEGANVVTSVGPKEEDSGAVTINDLGVFNVPIAVTEGTEISYRVTGLYGDVIRASTIGDYYTFFAVEGFNIASTGDNTNPLNNI